jgi:hypothetical protein
LRRQNDSSLKHAWTFHSNNARGQILYFAEASERDLQHMISHRRFTDIDHVLLNFIESGNVAVDNVLDVGISSGNGMLERY